MDDQIDAKNVCKKPLLLFHILPVDSGISECWDSSPRVEIRLYRKCF